MRILTVSNRLCMALVLMCMYTAVYGVVSWGLPPSQISKFVNGSPTMQECIATDGATTVVAAWLQEYEGKSQVFAAQYNVATKTWGTPVWISEEDKGQDCNLPRVVITGTGQACVTYLRDDNLNAVLFGPGSTLKARVEIADSMQNHPYSTIAYKAADGMHVLAAYGNDGSRSLSLSDFNATTNTAVLKDQEIISNSNAPDAGEHERRNPFLAIHPQTNEILLAWSQDISNSDVDAGPVGVVVPYPLAAPTAAAFTKFVVTGSDMREADYPHIVFNPADNKPHLLWATEIDGADGAHIVGTLWTNYAAPVGDIKDTYNTISTADLDEGYDVYFDTTTNGPNYFTVVYQQNYDPTSQEDENYVYGASYIPGSNSPANDQISTVKNNNRYGFPQVQNICPTSSGTYRNIVLWLQGNAADEGSSLAYTAVYTPGAAITERTLVSTAGEGLLESNTNTVGLVLANSGGQAVGIWGQFDFEDSEQVFGATGTLACPLYASITACQQVHKFPRCGDLCNIISIKATGSYAYYWIYRIETINSTTQDVLVGKLDATKENPTVFTECELKPCVEYKYKVYGVDSYDNRSEAVTVTFPVNK